MQSLAEIIGEGEVVSFGEAVAEAYGLDNEATSSAIAEAIVSGSSTNRKAIAEATANAFAEGGNLALAFADAFSQAISEGKCDQVAEAFSGVFDGPKQMYLRAVDSYA